MENRTKGLLVFVLIMVSFLMVFSFADQFKFGALEPSVNHEDKVSFGPASRFIFPRHEVRVPKAYGRLVTIAVNNGMTVLWFESDNGSIRNINLEGTEPVIIKRQGELQ